MKTKLEIVRELVDYIQKIEADPDDVTTFDLMNLKVLLRDLSEGNFAPLHVSKETPPPEGWTVWESVSAAYRRMVRREARQKEEDRQAEVLLKEIIALECHQDIFLYRKHVG